MALSVKTRFAGFLRGLIGRGEDPALAPPKDSVAPVATTAPAAAPAASPTPARATGARAFAPRAASAPRVLTGNEIELPLAAICAGLPLELKAKLLSEPAPDRTILLPAETVIGQLAFGAVKISFGELRQLAAGSFVNSGGEQDNKLVNLPLQEILPRLNPALLARRATRKVEVAEAIVGPFTGRGQGLTFTTQPMKSPSAAIPLAGAEPAPETPAALIPPAGLRNVSPPPMAPLVPPRAITPAAPLNGANGNGHSHPLAAPPPSGRSVTPLPNGGANGAGELGGNGHARGPGQGEGLAPGGSPGLRFGSMNGRSPAEMPATHKIQPSHPAPGRPAAPAPPAPPPPTIFVVLGELCQNWPEVLKNEILNTPLAQTKVPLDGASIQPGLLRGRVVMAWKQLRCLAQPNSAASPNDPLELELPLKVIAPLFLAGQKNAARNQAKTAVSAEIPDLFFGFPQPAPAAPAEAPLLPPLPKAPAPGAQDTNFFPAGDPGEFSPTAEAGQRRRAAQTDFLSRLAHPKDVVAAAMALPGVAGSVVAMQDGLRVASQVPAEFNADTLAAFLPQIVERVNQCTRELRMGALNNVNFTVGNVPWKIFRVNAVYFAAFGRVGEQLPSAQLAQLAAELERKK